MIFNMSTGGASTADKVKYNNTESGLKSTDVQGAIDEVNSSLSELLIIDSGRPLINDLPANGDYGYNVKFSKQFTSPPIVVATTSNRDDSTEGWGYNTVSVTVITNTGFIINVHNLENVKRNIYVNWIAVGK